MSQDFYELLRVSHTATTDEIRQAFRERTAQLARRLQSAQQHPGADTSALTAQQHTIHEAMQVLTNPQRRRSYNIFRNLSEQGMPDDLKKLWSVCKPAVVDPRVQASINVLFKFTQLPLQDLSLLAANKSQPEEAITAPRIEDIPTSIHPRRQRSKPQPAKGSQSQAKTRIQQMTTRKKPSKDATVTTTSSKKMPAKESPKAPPKAKVRSAPSKNQAAPKAKPTRPSRGGLSPAQLDTLAARLGYDGRFIRAVRERRNLTLEELSKATRISMPFLKAIEKNAFDKLPSPTFVKGYISNIARTLNIDDRPIVAGYMQLFRNKSKR